MSTMKFCSECHNLLYPKQDRENKNLLYACRSCDYKEVADVSEHCVSKDKEAHHAAWELAQIPQGVVDDPTLGRTTNIICKNCEGRKAGNSKREGSYPIRDEITWCSGGIIACLPPKNFFFTFVPLFKFL